MTRSLFLAAALLLAAGSARAQEVAPETPTGPPPTHTPESEAALRAQLEQESRARQAPGVYAQSAQEVDRERYDAWIQRGLQQRSNGFSLRDYPAGGVDVAGTLMAAGGGRDVLAIGSRLAAHVALWRWLSLDARWQIASEVFEGFHFVTTGGALSMRAEATIGSTPSERQMRLHAQLGAGIELPVSGGARSPDASLVVPFTVGATFCFVAIGEGCGGFLYEATFGLRVPFGGAPEQQIARGTITLTIGPAVTF